MKKVFIITIFLLFAANSASGTAKISGKYELVGNIDSLRNVKKVELVEFFNFSCGHCYRFLTASKRLETKYNDKLVHKSVPIFWGKQTPYPSMAYLIAKDNGKAEFAKKEIFNARFKMDIDVFDFRMISFIASSIGIGEEFEKGSRNINVKRRIEDIQRQANKYTVNETPTVILNGVIKVTPSTSGGDVDKMTDNLDRIIGDILNY